MRPRLRLLAPALLLPVLLTACGDDADESPATPSASALAATASAARTAYATAADGICSRAVAAAKRIDQPTSNAQVVAAVKATLTVGQEGLRALDALTPPPEDATALAEAFLDPVAEQVAAFRAVVPEYEAAATSSDPVAAFGRIADPGASVTVNLEYIEKYGMPACAVFAGKR